jgi:DNA-binding transcriptional LysR family regulator
MDRRRLTSFLALCEELHFDRAARRCRLTQPAISQQLRQLEEQLGVKLLYRTKRSVSLTRAGATFMVEARRIVGQMDHAAELARRIERGEVGEIVVGVTAPALYIVFPEIVARFAALQPHARLVPREMTTFEQEEALRAGEIQVGILHPPLVDETLVCRDIASTPFDVVLCERNPLAGKPDLRLADLARERFILFPRRIGPRLYDAILAMCGEVGFSPETVMEAHPAQSIVALAAGNFGVGFIASDVQHFRRPLAVYRRLAGPAPRITLGVATRADDASPLTQAFIEAARTAGAEVR